MADKKRGQADDDEQDEADERKADDQQQDEGLRRRGPGGRTQVPQYDDDFDPAL
mgnify:CR=1 FL=1